MSIAKWIVKKCITFFYKIKFLGKCKIHACTNVVLRGCSFEGKNSLGNYTYFSNSSLGYGTFIGLHSFFSDCKIGRFCSIGSDVRVVAATHPTSMVSTYPAFYSNSCGVSYVQKKKFKEHLLTHDGFKCKIGNDVWIGDNVLIKGGVSIGDGAVIAMGCVVIHDVEPYTIVGGVPAKEIRKRFDDDVITALRRIEWWNKPMQWIASNADYFENPQLFIKEFGK